jgi:hypothetical protein
MKTRLPQLAVLAAACCSILGTPQAVDIATRKVKILCNQ